MARLGRTTGRVRLGRRVWTQDTCAFQADSFQNDSFQVCIIIVSTPRPGRRVRSGQVPFFSAIRMRMAFKSKDRRPFGLPTRKPGVRRPTFLGQAEKRQSLRIKTSSRRIRAFGSPVRASKPRGVMVIKAGSKRFVLVPRLKTRTGLTRKFGKPTSVPPVRRPKIVKTVPRKPQQHLSDVITTKLYGRPTSKPPIRRVKVQRPLPRKPQQHLSDVIQVKPFGKPTRRPVARPIKKVLVPRQLQRRYKSQLRKAYGSSVVVPVIPTNAVFLLGPDKIIYPGRDFTKISNNTILILEAGKTAFKVTGKIYMEH